MNIDAAGANALIMAATSLSAIAAKTIGNFGLLVSSRYDARASAPAGLCAASSSTSPPAGILSHSRRAGHWQSERPATIASVEMLVIVIDQRSRIATATAAFSS